MKRLLPLFCLGAALPAAEAPPLRVLGDAYPRAYFFRMSEGQAALRRMSYEQWEKTFERLMGIEGKTLEEEVPGRSGAIEYFARFKQRHPDQLVMLHYNGNARDPRDGREPFFAGHWLHFNGAKLTADLAAARGESDVAVENPALFRTGVGRYKNGNEDVTICSLDASGKPDWFACEETQLVSVDARAKKIRVKRGAYGTEPRTFAGGRAYAASHVSEGPWGKGSNLLWFYNYSTHAPRDRRGRTCAEVLSDDLARHFAPGGKLASFDGLQFDVLQDSGARRDRGRGTDADGDGAADGGVTGGVNAYGIGVIEFCRMLRAKLGPRRLILADGMGLNNQRAFGILNGIESEGFPHLRDFAMRDWSGGLNRHFFWRENAAAPVFNYINHKFNEPGDDGLPVPPELPFSTHRLVFAAAVFTDSAICYSLAPKAEPGESLGVWDELRMGMENKLAWLGKPRGAPVRLAERSAPVFERARLMMDRVEEGSLSLTVTGVPLDGPDLYLAFTVKGKALPEYPAERARLMKVSIGEESFMTWVNQRDFRATFYFPEMKGKSADVRISVEGTAEVLISDFRAWPRPDVMLREFEHGVVLANPSPRPRELDLARLLPGSHFRRLRGSPGQDAKTNDGSAVEGAVRLGPKDALFLVRR